MEGGTAMTLHFSRLLITTFVLVAVLAVPYAARSAVVYYVSLGDSLAFGYQPNEPNGPFNQGYSDKLFEQLRAKNPELQLVKLGCPAETTDTMINGGICYYPHGSQLSEAAAFLQQNPVALVTIDIGANDIRDCSFVRPLNMRCVRDVLAKIETNLPTILATLEENAGGAPIVGMNYYDPYLAYWVLGDRAAAADSLRAFLKFNDTLERIYKASGSLVANVEGAFSSTNFQPQVASPSYGKIPLNVALICDWTWACELSDESHTEVHPNTIGYGKIADAFSVVVPFP